MSARVTKDEFPATIAEGLVLADFYSDSCLPCKRISPLLAELEEAGLFRLVKVNVAYEPELTEQYNVQAAPTLVIFRDGAEAARLRGAVKRDEIIAALDAAKE